MELKLLNKRKNIVSFVVKGTNPAYMNTIRRLITGEVPAMAIKTVHFTKNTSALYDEILAHRLGLVVLKTDLSSYELIESCKCEGKGCARCSVDFTLSAEGPCTVYADMLKCADTKIVPVFPKTVIAKLAKNQQIEFEAKAVLGCGKNHAKFSPGHVYYYGAPSIKVDPKKDTAEAVRVCPKHVFKLDNNKAVVNDLMACDLCMACVEACPDNIEVVGSEKDFVMFVEAWGQLSPDEMVVYALKVFDEKTDKFVKELKSLK
ncbi:MAG: DNA-directed RNA polymerase subunit D [Nanoarchaeota archaeon]